MYGAIPLLFPFRIPYVTHGRALIFEEKYNLYKPHGIDIVTSVREISLCYYCAAQLMEARPPSPPRARVRAAVGIPAERGVRRLGPAGAQGDGARARAVPEARRGVRRAVVLRPQHRRVRARRVEALPQDLCAELLGGASLPPWSSGAAAARCCGQGVLTGVCACVHPEE